jgi:DNA-binding MarR family transcriptional regulator
MVERETEPDGDKRTRYLRLTEHGDTLLRARVARRTSRARHVLAGLPDNTREEILSALQTLLGACRETFGTVAPPGE